MNTGLEYSRLKEKIRQLELNEAKLKKDVLMHQELLNEARIGLGKVQQEKYAHEHVAQLQLKEMADHIYILYRRIETRFNCANAIVDRLEKEHEDRIASLQSAFQKNLDSKDQENNKQMLAMKDTFEAKEAILKRNIEELENDLKKFMLEKGSIDRLEKEHEDRIASLQSAFQKNLDSKDQENNKQMLAMKDTFEAKEAILKRSIEELENDLKKFMLEKGSVDRLEKEHEDRIASLQSACQKNLDSKDQENNKQMLAMKDTFEAKETILKRNIEELENDLKKFMLERGSENRCCTCGFYYF